jgi:surface protein
LLLKAQSSQTNYQYWIDDNKDEAVYGIADGEDIVLDIDVGSLSPGVHFYNIRAYDTVGSKRKWGTTYRYLFCIPQDVQASPKDLASYEYWIDNDYEHRVTTAVSGDKKEALLAIDVSNLSSGVHFYNMRAQDEDGSWGAVLRQVFCIPKQQKADVHRLITGYSYSFDGITPTNVVFDSPIEEYTLIKSFDIPSCQPPMVIDDDCSFVFDEDEEVATLSRNINVSFSLFFTDQQGAISSPESTDFVAQDKQMESIQYIVPTGSALVANHSQGGFSVISFEVGEAETLEMKTTGNCSLRLYSPYSQLLDSYDAEALTGGVMRAFEEGTYYAVVYGNTKEIQLLVGQLKVATPVISQNRNTITISTETEEATIYYTMDGSEPTSESMQYTGSFKITEDCVIKAIAFREGYHASEIATADAELFRNVYAVFDSGAGVLTFRYGVMPEGSNVYEMGSTAYTTSNHPVWYNLSNLTTVIFDESMVDAHPKSTAHWFCHGISITEIQGLNYLNTSSVINMEWMFNECKSLKTLDLSNFDTHQVKDMNTMFTGCSSLTTIYVGDDWTTENVTDSHNMFANCNSLTGGKGTKYSASYIEKTYARIDGGTSAPGYFTYKSSDGIPGDVNGDGVVDVEDIVGIVNYILNEPADDFIEANADVSGDGKIDVDDVVATVNIILDSNPASVPQMRQVLIKRGFWF